MRLPKHALIDASCAAACIVAVGLLVFGLLWRQLWLSYEVFIPSTPDRKPLPTLLVLHGRSGQASTMRAWSGFDELAQKHGFIVIYPQSKYDGWNFGVGVRPRWHTARRYVDHSQYIASIIDDVAKSHPIDRSRVVLAGVSDGASMATHMTCQKEISVKAVVTVAATIPFYAIENCENTDALNILMIHGMQDTVMPWQGKLYKEYKVYLSLYESIDWWRERNGCENDGNGESDFEQYRGKVDRLFVDNCKNATQLAAYRVHDGGHTWPGRMHPTDRTNRLVNDDIDATALVSRWIMSL